MFLRLKIIECKVAKISKEEFDKALVALEEAHSECVQQLSGSKIYKLYRDASIKRFEFCIELAWKVSVKSLGTTSSSPKPALREMLKSGLITDINQWFDFLDQRNKSSHSYDEQVAKEVFGCIAAFIDEAKTLLSRL